MQSATMAASDSSFEPSWAVPPPSNDTWTLVEIKGGVEVASYPFQQKCIVLGRAASDLGTHHVTLAHESCSRHHARIAFDSGGIPWLRDLASSHGTFVNKKKLPPAACGKEESSSSKRGSRGVVLYPGDVLQFGASTRMYCVEGPPEYERGAVKLRKQVAESSLQSTTSTRANVGASDNNTALKPTDEDDDINSKGFSWGMADDIAIDEANSGGGTANKKRQEHQPLDPSKIPEKHRKLFERLTAKQYKLQNVQLESERIRSKGTDLSQGQEAQLRKNDERIQIWQREIDELEQDLHNKMFPDTKHVKKKTHVNNADINDEDDDYAFYDRTKNTGDDLFEDGETQESLVSKWKELLQEWKRCSHSLLETRQKADRLEQRLKQADPNDEDAFFLQNDVDLQKDSLSKAEERKEEIANNLKETERLLKVVNSNLEFNRETGFIEEPGKEKPKEVEEKAEMQEDTAMMPPPVSASSPLAPPRTTLSPAATAMPPPFQMPPPMDMPPPQMSMSKRDAGMLPPPPAAKRTRILGPTMPPPAGTLAVDEMEMPPPRGQYSPPPRPRAPPIGTLSVLAAASSSSKRDKQNSASPKHSPKKPNDTTNGFDSKKDSWKAPKDQDGSGITKLNAKFAGRY